MPAHSYKFSDSQTVAVTAASASYTRPVGGAPMIVRFISDVGAHVAWNRPATVTDAYISPECVEDLSVGPNDVIHVIRATGASDGTGWFTEALRS